MLRRIDPVLTARARDLRNNATPAERVMWQRLARYRPAFTRQLVIAPFIVDLACREAKLAVEFDGSQHLDSVGYDERRTLFLRERGWRVLRLWNSDVLRDPDGAAEFVLVNVAECLGDTHQHRVNSAPRCSGHAGGMTDPLLPSLSGTGGCESRGTGERHLAPSSAIDNHSQRAYLPCMASLVTLESFPRRQPAAVAAIEWGRLSDPEARRLRELGFDEGVPVEVLHRATLGAGPIACQVGRMTIALRRAVAAAIRVHPLG